MKQENIIQRNFFRLIRSGAFEDPSPVEAMSPFKWRRLYDMVESQRVVGIFVRGASRHIHDDQLNIPADVIERAHAYMDAHPSPPTTGAEPHVPDTATLSNRLLNHRLEHIAETERHAMDTSTESVGLLRLIVYNVDAMLNRGMSLDGIVRLGQYLRAKGGKVDFVKVDAWLVRLHLTRMAELQGNILVTTFGFEQDEIPFVRKPDRDARQITLRAVSHLVSDTVKEWHFRQGRAGFVENNSRILRRHLRRSIRYFTYAPIETTSNFFAGIGRSLSEIEE